MKDQNQVIFNKVEHEAVKKINGIILSLEASASACVSRKFIADEPVPISVKFYEEVNQRKFKEAAKDEGFTDISFADNGSSANLSYPFDYEKVRKTEIVNVVQDKIIDAVNKGLNGRGYIEEVSENGYDTWTITLSGIDPDDDKNAVFDKVFDSIAPIIIVNSWGEYGLRGFWLVGNLR